MKVDFYRLTTAPIDAVLPKICERVLAEGGRLLIVSADERQRSQLDTHLWAYARDSFLPHGQSGEGEDGQPILLSSSCEPTNDAANIAIIDGQWRDEALAFERVFHFFDDDAIEAARAAWRGLADRDGTERRYWKHEDGRWSQVA